MSKPVGKFINFSEDWELNYCLKKYSCPESKDNREKLTALIKNHIKPYFRLKNSENLSWDQIDEYYQIEPKGLKPKK